MVTSRLVGPTPHFAKLMPGFASNVLRELDHGRLRPTAQVVLALVGCGGNVLSLHDVILSRK